MTALVTSIYILQGCLSVGICNGHSFGRQKSRKLLIEKDQSSRGHDDKIILLRISGDNKKFQHFIYNFYLEL